MVPQEQLLRVQNESILFIIMTNESILNPFFGTCQGRSDRAGLPEQPWVCPCGAGVFFPYIQNKKSCPDRQDFLYPTAIDH
jgi:hypothetical protein